MKTQKATPQNKANYITKLVKSVGKNLDYALSIVVWYTMTDKEQKEVEQLIQDNWNK